MRKALFAFVITSHLGMPSLAADSSLWQTKSLSKQANSSRFRSLITQADELAHTTAQTYQRYRYHQREGSSASARRALGEVKRIAEKTLRILERAKQQAPDNASVHLWLGSIKAEFLFDYYEARGLRSRRDAIGREALKHWSQFETLASSDPRRINFARSIAIAGVPQPYGGPPLVTLSYHFKRSIIHTKLGSEANLRHALADYDHMLALTPNNAADRALLLTNSAEILMALGELDRAIARYREGIAASLGSPRVLYMYGLAVALDRADQTQTALQLMRYAAMRDEAPLAQLKNGTVFFVPHGDIYYYQALGLEAIGDCDGALTQLDAFITQGSARYRAVAERRVQFLRAARRHPKGCRPVPLPNQP